MQKYRPLGDYLIKQNEVLVSLTFQKIEQILGFTLPLSAYNHRAWWANSLSHPQAGSWVKVGWRVSKVNIGENTVFFRRPVILSIQKVIDNGEAFSLMTTTDNETLVIMLSGPDASATVTYPWRQIVQMLIDANPHLFGNLTHQPDHYIFPEMLAKLGYTVVNRETGESWKARKM